MRSDLLGLRNILTPAVLSAAFFAFACGDDEAPMEEEDLPTELCEHLTEGPFQNVTSSTTAAGAPDATFDHTAVVIALDGGAGFVSYQAREATDFAFALTEDVPLEITQGGNAVDIESTERPTGAPCTELEVIHTVELEVGTATLELGPSSVTSVTMVVEETGHAHEEE